MILAPNEMKAEPDERKAAKICLEKIALDPEWYRIGHTKARNNLNDFPPNNHISFLLKREESLKKITEGSSIDDSRISFQIRDFFSLEAPPSYPPFETRVWPRI